jgi:diguanylate cyclase (GGDEF)-like protein
MDRVLLLIKKKKDRRRLEDLLSPVWHIVLPNPEAPLEENFDLALIDGPSLRELGSEVRAKRKAQEPVLLPFLFLTLRHGSLAAKHLGRLVDDVIVRPLNERELLARVANLLRMRRFSLELKKEHDRVMKLAVTDDVSGFNNTRYLHRYLDRIIDDNAAQRQPEVCLVFFDLDSFKKLVDRHGHLLGSKALREVAQAVHKVLDPDDRIVRYGGDEFIVILPRQNKQEALAKVTRMREAIHSTAFLARENIHARLTASFGVASYPHDAANKHELLAEADRCLFQSKNLFHRHSDSGRNPGAVSHGGEDQGYVTISNARPRTG